MSNIQYGRKRRLRPKSIWLVVLASGTFGSDDVPQVPSTVGKVTMIYGNNSVYERALDTHKEHCRRLRYPLFVLRRPILDGVWNKYAILLSVLLQELEKPVDRQLQWLLWFDSDTVLMNPNMPLETFLPPAHLSDVHMLLTKDWNGMNNGVFFIRVHKWSVELLTAATAYPVVNPDVELYWPDQSALDNVFKENHYFSRSVVYCPLRWFNAYMRSPDGMAINPDSPADLQVHPGDLLVHFPGTGQDHLGQTLGPYIAIAEEHRAEWEPTLESTHYTEETESFWKKHAPVVS
ncbi:galactosyl transferase GMA12/MNN10 family protein [Aspergillus nomiae NRRL 13137]|uniref:Galactosyl transferase GMA12/MNN10 family protein n=1 Tax=Aspergillus nomiae NRRL (strain ATCC 15546 / NRRL 13137 / CBS 260.88 / M93) TaxID=1509407 RepID=A0A0L1IJW3_ASPN3|nr:galactosyl transferase GMA12/MNN10 family protein [Aspergillus nomiae NRRL 13137]KNG79896.1 galactosyl transferase GMA12/MNN10 family protein [Aspergillus nomiae NRRL 13137]